ncbi:LacI family transcriptional regulator [Amycolatopsis sp. NBC_01488]|uniref:LacI family DNA-binding transcriptional regulator n=1 Tax=Amycolatopsis sp. NBC_01488 TaxID=2903563 RepID=UPI002E2D914F|nr:LacI family DNA-binding transcriptional regulator [Amycolatopsis sp. NBC_01488]
MKRPTITDIAREAGVSKGAVSYALNGRPGVSEATRHRITRIARELGWSPSSTARALSGGRAGAIGLVLDGPAEACFPALLDGFSPELLVQVTAGREAALAVYRRWRAERRVDGVLLTGPECAAEVVRIGLPAVVLGGAGGVPDVPSVRVDDAAGAAEALEYLAALGHRHVVRIAGAAPFADAAERESAFAAEARRLGLAGARTAGGAAFAGAGERESALAAEARRLGLASGWTAGAGSAESRGVGGAAFAEAGESAFGAEGRRLGSESGQTAPPGSAESGVAGVAGYAGAGERRSAFAADGRRLGLASARAACAGSAEFRGVGAGAAGPGDPHAVSGVDPAAGIETRVAGSVPGAGNRPTGHTEPSADAVRRVLGTHPRPTALLCDTDSLAVAALAAARELGLSVPRDLSVVSWDDSELCRLVRPALTAIRRPLPELGALAASMLRDLIAGQDVGDVCASRPRLVTRGSTGPAR